MTDEIESSAPTLLPPALVGLSIESDPPGASSLGELRASGWHSEPVKREMRRNLLLRIAAGRAVVDGVIGYDDSVLPAIEHAIIACLLYTSRCV